jgi:hypothetical protein
MIELGDEVQIITEQGNGHGFEYLERGFIISISTDGFYLVESEDSGEYEITINDFELI